MKKILMFLMLALFVSCSDTTTEPEDKNATKVNIAELSTQPGFETYQSSYDSYMPNANYIDSLSSVYSLSDDQFYFYLKLDCQCNATTKLFPRMMKTLDAAGISHDNINIYIMLDETYNYPEKDFITVTDLPQLFVKHGTQVIDLTETPDSVLVESVLYKSFK
ncbi:MAG: hypothetical protein RIF34_10435 [Candidatus Kapaibacterium sp.]